MAYIQKVAATVAALSVIAPALTGVVKNNTLALIVNSTATTVGEAAFNVPTDSTGQIWLKAVGAVSNGNSSSDACKTAIYYLLSANAGDHTITLSSSPYADSKFFGYTLVELPPCYLVDVSSTNFSNTLGTTGDSATTANTSGLDIVLAALAINETNGGLADAGITNTDGYTNLFTENNTVLSMGAQHSYFETAVVGPQAAHWSWTAGAGTAWSACVATFTRRGVAYVGETTYEDTSSYIAGGPGPSAASVDITLVRPTNTLQGHLLLLLMSSDHSLNEAVITAGDWLVKDDHGGVEFGTDGQCYYILYKFVGASEPSSYTFTAVNNSQNGVVANMRAYAGVDPITPFADLQGTLKLSAVTYVEPVITVVAPAATAPVNNCMSVGFFMTDDAVERPTSFTVSGYQRTTLIRASYILNNPNPQAGWAYQSAGDLPVNAGSVSAITATFTRAWLSGSAPYASYGANIILQPVLPTPPVFTIVPGPYRAPAGSVGTVTGAATPVTGPISYQWQKNIAGTWTNISGATSGSYSPPTLGAGESYELRIAASDNESTIYAVVPVWSPVKKPAAWASYYGKGGRNRGFGAAFGGRSPGGKAAGRTFENALFGTISGTSVKLWNGSAWVVKPVKVWAGSAWVVKPVKRWNGGGWV